jgi:hypothetical protein
MRFETPPWIRWLVLGKITRRLLIAVCVLAVVLAGSLVYIWVTDPSCGKDVEKRGPGDECTGVTDGDAVFAPSLKAVFGRIKEENERIAGQRHATIALMVPMNSGNTAEQRQILEEIQGAYLAQYRANHLSNSRAPAIRLVLANPGRNNAHWRPVADRLAEMTTSRHNLRAVTGFNISMRSTAQAIAYLTNEKGIPVVGGPITADDIANSAQRPDAFKGLARVAPNNNDEATALASFDRTVKPSETAVVEDIREGDNYISTLRRTFERLAAGAPLAPETYESPRDNVNDEGNLSNDFHQMVTNICVSSARHIYFAGRPVQLRQFVNELGKRACADKHYTVISGSHASTLAVDQKFDWDALGRGRGITMRYASLAHPDAWTGPGAPKTGGSAAAYRNLSDLVAQFGTGPAAPVGEISLTDSRTIITYDSVSTAVAAIRNNTVGNVPMPTLTQVGNSWLRLHGPNKVEGASGWICLDRYGNPYDKAVSVVHLDPDTRSARFDGLAWPEGVPPAASCTAPNRR